MSNREYKKKLAEYNKKTSQYLNKKYCCAPTSLKESCTKKIISAHTVSRCLGIDEISEKGHVYGVPRHSLFRLKENKGNFEIEKIGVRKASTLLMFCSEHDKQIFSPLEDGIFGLNKENCFLLAYRAICREWYSKNNAQNIREIFDNQLLKMSIDAYFTHGNYAGYLDLIRVKYILDDALIKKDYNILNHYVFELKGKNNLVTSFAYSPDENFKKEKIQDLLTFDKFVVPIVVNSIFRNNRGYIIFSWEKEFDVLMSNYIDSLLTKNKRDQSLLLTNLFFKVSENVYWNISWWNNLTKKQKRAIKNYIHPLNKSSISSLKNADVSAAFYIYDSYFLSEKT